MKTRLSADLSGATKGREQRNVRQLPLRSQGASSDLRANSEPGAGRFAKGFRRLAAFTLIELLVVIAIIAILAAILLPVLGKVKLSAQKRQASLDIAKLVTAIKGYESAYNQYPVSSNAMNAAAAASAEDFTYGGLINGQLVQSPTPQYAPGLAFPNGYHYNAEVIGILMDWTNYPDGTPVYPNPNHVKNPQHTPFLNAQVVSGTNAGVGEDGVFRDPWGTPYVVTVDLNYDQKARDGFYRAVNVSEKAGRGINGLIPGRDQKNNAVYEAGSGVMVWSAGPDKKVDPSQNADVGFNKDNILSWK